MPGGCISFFRGGSHIPISFVQPECCKSFHDLYKIGHERNLYLLGLTPSGTSDADGLMTGLWQYAGKQHEMHASLKVWLTGHSQIYCIRTVYPFFGQTPPAANQVLWYTYMFQPHRYMCTLPLQVKGNDGKPIT